MKDVSQVLEEKLPQNESKGKVCASYLWVSFFFSAIFVRRCLYFRSNVLPFIFFSSLILSVSYEKRYFGKSCGCALLGYLNTNLPFLGPFSAIGKVRY